MPKDGVQVREVLVQAHNMLMSGHVEFSHMITVGVLPTGAKEVIINTEQIPSKIEYLLNAYDENMALRANPEIRMEGLLLISR